VERKTLEKEKKKTSKSLATGPDMVSLRSPGKGTNPLYPRVDLKGLGCKPGKRKLRRLLGVASLVGGNRSWV